MILQIRCFAGLKEVTGAEVISVAVDPPVTVGKIRRQMTQDFPQLSPLLDRCLFAVNEDYAAEESVVEYHDQIACIPPVSGG